MSVATFRVATDGRYEIVDRGGEIVHVHEQLGHALHHLAAGHLAAPSCCPGVDRNGDVRVGAAPLAMGTQNE